MTTDQPTTTRPTDTDRIAEAVTDWQDGLGAVSTEIAQLIASQWHGGMTSPLYAFASSGYVRPSALAHEIDWCLPGASDADTLALLALDAHLCHWSEAYRTQRQA